MRVTTRTQNLTEPEKEQFERYLEEKMKRLHGRLDKHYPDEDTVKLDVRLEKHDKHTAFELEFVLTTPHNGRFVATETKHSITEGMDKATDILVQDLNKHFDKLIRH